MRKSTTPKKSHCKWVFWNQYIQTKLDALCTKYVKKWTGLPPCATNSIVHMKTGLDIMSIPHVYSLSHSLAHS